jgi:hypothetical protein
MSILFFIWRFSFERSHFLLRFKQSQGYHSISSHQSSFFSILFDFILFFKVHSFKGPLIGVVNLYIFQYSIKRFWSSCNNIFFIVIFNYFILINFLKFYAYIGTICVKIICLDINLVLILNLFLFLKNVDRFCTKIEFFKFSQSFNQISLRVILLEWKQIFNALQLL